MMKIKLIYLLSLLFVLGPSISAQNNDVSFKTICKKQVIVGEQFQVSYELNEEGKDFKAPNFINFEIIGGPFSSTSSSVQIINGSVTKTKTVTYSFYLRAIKEGKFDIPSATITVGRNKIKSESCEINVVADTRSGNGNSTSGGTGGQVSSGNKEVFLEAIPSKTKVYLGEQILLTYKIFFTIRISSPLSVSKSPSYSGFWTKDITNNNGSLQPSSIIRNGQQYKVATIQEIVLFPQKSGTLTIDPLDINCIAQIKQQRNRSQSYDPFENFFDDIMGSSYTNVRKNIKSQPIKIEVEPLPVANKPDNFKGAVGQFTYTSKIDKSSLKANEAFTLTLTVSGKGNIELLELPKPVFPPDFEVYDPKITFSTKSNASGINGTKKAEFVVIPRVSGDFTIEGTDFTYFNPSNKKYVTLSSDTYNIHVEKGSNEGINTIYTPGQTDIKYLGNDIRHINTSDNKLSITGMTFFLSPLYNFIVIITIVIFIICIYLHKKIIRLNQNQVLIRNKKATKMAKRRLQNAYNYLKDKNQDRFYEEYSQALWGYISDKLNITRSQLSMNTVKEMMQDKNIPENIVDEFIDLLNNCEFARFAPGDPEKKMEDLYQKGIEVITKAEKLLK